MTYSALSAASLLLAFQLGASAPTQSAEMAPNLVGENSATSIEATSDRSIASDWIADSDDHICGLSSLRALSDPAKVDYSVLWDATPEIKEMKRDGIDPGSAEGIQLQQKAKRRILKACKSVQDDRSNCSVWKAIKHKDGRTISDITEKVKAKFPE